MLTLRRNVLIFHQAALGDFVLTWPIALAAARLWPTNRTIYLTSSDKGQLAERAIGVEWRDGDSWHPLFAEHATLSEANQKLLAGATLILSFVSNGNDAWATNVRRLAPEAKLVFVQPRPLEPIDQHLTLFHAEQFTDQPHLQAAIGQMIRHVHAAGASPRRGVGESIVLHPGSGAASKRWTGFATLAEQLHAQGHRVTVLLGEVERDQFTDDEIRALSNAADILQPANLVELFTVLQSAKVYVGNDTGPTHLASIMGVPAVVLFGQDNDTTWRPIGPGVRVVKQVPLTDLPADAVLAAVTEAIASSPQVTANLSADED